MAKEKNDSRIFTDRDQCEIKTKLHSMVGADIEFKLVEKLKPGLHQSCVL